MHLRTFLGDTKEYVEPPPRGEGDTYWDIFVCLFGMLPWFLKPPKYCYTRGSILLTYGLERMCDRVRY